MSSIKIKCPPSYNGTKITVIKAIRTLTGMGLKEAKDVSETTSVVTLNVVSPSTSTEYSYNMNTQVDILRDCGVDVDVVVGDTVGEKLRKLAVECIGDGDYENADAIYAMVLSLKQGT
jgi:Ribosomal protein L7/L12 C-terminal domain